MLTRSGPRPGVIVEMHPNAWVDAGWSRAAAEDTLRQLGLRPFGLSDQVDPFAEYGQVVLVPAS
jgi:hypothetical protein